VVSGTKLVPLKNQTKKKITINKNKLTELPPKPLEIFD
jgi:hypothetical protein